MSHRESRIRPVSLTVVGGVNERVRDTELKPQEYKLLEGVFPEFAGLQSRVWGKRLLKLYEAAIYGIHQFWTPQGYGGGIYQFDGQIDFGYWLTPTSSFDLSIPPIGYDGGGMTLDEFGLPYGSNFGYGTDNACVISFLNGSSDHSSCQPPPSPADVPDDSNGGPAGQGRQCRWTAGTDIVIAAPAVGSYQFGTGNNETVTNSGPVPYPIFPNETAVKPSIYSGTAGPFNFIWYASYSEFSYKINLGFGNWFDHQGWTAHNTKGIINLTGVVADPNNPPTMIELRIRHNGNSPFDFFWVTLPGVTFGDGANYAAFPLDMWDLLLKNYSQVPHPLGGGFLYSDFVVADQVRAVYKGRSCSDVAS